MHADGPLISVEQSECTHDIAERSKSNSGSDSGSADGDRCNNSGREDRQRRRYRRGRQRDYDFFLIMVDHVLRRFLLFIRMLQRPISQSPQSHYRFS